MSAQDHDDTPRRALASRGGLAAGGCLLGLLAGGTLALGLSPAVATTPNPPAKDITQVAALGSCELGPGRWIVQERPNDATRGLSGGVTVHGVQPGSVWRLVYSEGYTRSNAGFIESATDRVRADDEGTLHWRFGVPRSRTQSYGFRLAKRGDDDICAGKVRTATRG